LEFDHGTYAFMEEALSLYDLLISPIEKTLESSGIRHLVFIPDGPLGNIPLAALRNRRNGKYLVQNVSLSIAPSFSMIGAPIPDKQEPEALLAGVSDAVQGFVALPAVENELKSIARIYQNHTLKLNPGFTRRQMLEDLPDSQADIVHIASHGEFRSAAGESYLLAHDRKMSMDDLEEMISPRKFTGKPVELLCLSACRTAAGDDRAALGLAGVAVKSGARSVVASLWYVDDTAAANTMVGFHRHLWNDGKSKAEALRQAQLDILKQDPLAHPYLWAPFILIGDWK
jgi:CHAT domain-containing protein